MVFNATFNTISVILWQSVLLVEETMIDVSLFLVILIQYSQRHSVINHCDRCITLLSDTDISFALFTLFTYIYLPFVSPRSLRVQIPLRQGVLDTTLCDKVCQ
jgi:hypothetical protein